jgi:hypothetical protein
MQLSVGRLFDPNSWHPSNTLRPGTSTDLCMPLFRAATRSIPLLLAVVLAVLALLLFGRIPGDARWAWVLGNAAHAPALAAVTVALIELLRRPQADSPGVLRDYAFAIAIALTLGALVELTQLGTGRDASLIDLARNALGSLAAAGFMAVYDPRVRALPAQGRIRRAGLLIGVLSTLIVMTQVLIAAGAYLQRARNFPVLVDFSSTLSTYFVSAYDAITVERTGLPSIDTKQEPDGVGLHARIVGSGGWALVLWEPYPDWRGFDHLALELVNTSTNPLVMRIRVRDRIHRADRKAGYVGSIEVEPRSRKVHQIKLQEITSAGSSASLDPAMIHSLSLTAHAGNRATDFYVTRIWLE